MCPRETDYFRVHEHSAALSKRNGSSEEKIEPPTQEQANEKRRVLTFRRLLTGLILLTGLSMVTGVGLSVYGEKTKDVNSAIREAHAKCETIPRSGPQVLCDLTAEFERLKEVVSVKDATIILSMSVVKNRKHLINEWHYIKLNESKPEEVSALIDRVVLQIKSLPYDPEMSIFGYATFTKHLPLGQPDKPNNLMVTQDFTAVSTKEVEGKSTQWVAYRSGFDEYVPYTNAGYYPYDTFDFRYTTVGDPTLDGPHRTYPGYGGRVSLDPRSQLRATSKYLSHLRPWEQELYFNWIAKHPIQWNPPKG